MAPEYRVGWWGQTWLQYLAGLGVSPESEGRRRSALRAAARFGFERGAVRGQVEMGSRTANVSVRVKPFTDGEWKKLLASVATDADAAQRLLAGNPGAELATHCQRLGLSLYPATQRQAPVRCSCDLPWNCRHMNALALQGALLLDANPYLWLEVRGRPRPELFAQLRACLANQAGARTAPAGPGVQPLSAEHYWQTPIDPADITVRPGAAGESTALLAALGPLPLPPELAGVEVLTESRIGMVPERRSLDSLLPQYVARVAEGAAALALGERPPVHAAAKLPGKAIALEQRLAPEVESAVRQAEGVIGLRQLRERCPTAAAQPDIDCRPALSAALSALPPDLLVLAGAYAGERAAVLSGATFEHVVTFDEWLQQDFSADADWVRALQAAGCTPPFRIEAAGGVSSFARLQPEVGDTVVLRVVDPTSPGLSATLRRRDEPAAAGGADRPESAPAEADRQAADLLRRHMAATGRELLTEDDAVSVLLAEGCYRRTPGPGPVWLLPMQIPGWGWPATLRTISAQLGYRRPDVAQPRYGHWPRYEEALRQFAMAAREANHGQREVEAAVDEVRRWCEFCGGAQNSPDGAADLGRLLGYLWLVRPAVPQSGVAVPAVLAHWFQVLSERVPKLRQHYAAHIRACQETAAFRHRVRTLPPLRNPAGRLAWQLAGYRWIGAARSMPTW